MNAPRNNEPRQPTRVFTGPLDEGAYRVSKPPLTQGRKGGERRHGATGNTKRRPGLQLTSQSNPRATRRPSARLSSRPKGHPNARTGRHPRTRGIALLLAALSIMAILAQTVSHRLAPAANGAIEREASAQSDPRGQWRKGEVPRLYQIDPQWDDEPYAGGTIRENGCGPTALSMVHIALTGDTSLDPVAMARFSEQNGHTSGSLTAWTLMSEGATDIGLDSTELPARADIVTSELDAGHPIICSVGPGDFTTSGHFIVLVGITRDGRVEVHDPNSAARSERPWDLELVLGQCVNLWAFSVM